MIDENNTPSLDQRIMEGVRSMPDQAVPDGFAARVMADLAPKRPSFRTRLRLWLTEPRSVTFTPARVIPAVALALAILFVGLWSVDGPTGGGAAPSSSVRFVLNDAGHEARTVAVIGSFNDWQPSASAMRYDSATGTWVLETRLPQGDHEYVFLVDGQRVVPDPHAPITRDDGFGNTNSIVFVDGSHEQML